MSKGKAINNILSPLSEVQTQTYLGKGLHTLGLIGWLLDQTGPANVYVTTFSTSEAFLSGFLRLKRKGLIKKSVLLADLKASKKTLTLNMLMQNCFDRVLLGMNHSKIVLLQNERHYITVISSQNQTYGDRAECTMVTTDKAIYSSMYIELSELMHNSHNIDGLLKREASGDSAPREPGDVTDPDLLAFGY